MTNVLLVGGVPAAHREVLAIAERSVLLLRRADYSNDLHDLMVDELILLEGSDGVDSALDQLHQAGNRVDHVAAFHDDYHELAHALALALALPYYVPSDAVRRTKNKALARRIANGISPMPLEFREFGDVGEVRGCFDSGQSWIVKPVSGVSSAGVHRVHSWDELVLAVAGSKGPWLLEQELVGREFSVESWSLNGSHSIIGITEKRNFPGTYIPMEHVFPADVSQTEYGLIATFVSKFLDEVGATSGPAHTEVVLDSAGIAHLIECQLRLGGGGITELIEHVCGFSPLETVAQHALGALPNPEGWHRHAAKVAIARYLHVDGVGLSLHSVDVVAARRCAGVVSADCTLGVGQPVPKLRSGTDRWAWVRVVAQDHQHARRSLTEAVAALRITVTQPADEVAATHE